MGTLRFTTHTSSRTTFKTCQTKWFYSAKEALNLSPIRPVPALHFGTGIHAALEAYYDPAPHADMPNVAVIGDAEGRLLFAWDVWCREERKRFTDEHPRLMEDSEFVATLDEQEALGRGMLAHYATWAPIQDNFTVIWVERQYEYKVGRGHRTNLYYSFKPDMLVKDNESGLLWLVDHKTASSLSDSDEWLQMDEQVGSYILGLERVEGIRVEGVIHNTLRKKIPQPLRLLKDGRYSTDVRQDTTFDIAAKALMDKYGTAEQIPSTYHELLEKLRARNNFFRRTRVRRNHDEIVRLGATIDQEAREMVRKLAKPETITRSPSQWNCSNCAFKAPCILRFEGRVDEERELLDQLYYREDS